MAATAGGGDVWRITGEERVKHDAQFFQLKPVNGFISGEQAKGFFVQSGLPTPVLGQIWTLADVNGDGRMDRKEFSIAMHLIKKKLQGYELPKSLPSSLKAAPSPVIGSFGMTQAPMQPMGTMGFGMPRMSMMAPTSITMSTMGNPVMSNGVVPGTGIVQPGFEGMPVTAAMMMDNKAMTFSTPAPAAGVTVGFAMPHQNKLKYTQLFNVNDRHKRGFLSGVEARAILMQSALSQPLLAQIWVLSDIDNDGMLTCDEFCIAMHFIDFVKSGKTLPQKLPPELLPFKPRSGSVQGQMITPPSGSAQPTGNDVLGDLLGGMGIASSAPEPAANGEEIPFEDLSPVTFEDKRHENFLKGQAELDRRRQILQEQLKAQENARLEKERQEHEKRERARQEQERKKQLELEKHLEKQRKIEREREEQRQKLMEQREAAKRELERQRQTEWEQQRKKELLAEKGREYEALGMLKSKENNLKCELESLKGKKNEFSQKITQVRNGVTDFTNNIEGMRLSRDTKTGDIEKLQHGLQELSQKYLRLQQDREQLNVCVQTTLQSNPLSETHRTMMHSVELKKSTVQRLKKELDQVERDTEAKLTDIDKSNAINNERSNEINVLQKDISQIQQNKKKLDVAQQVGKADHRAKQEQLRKELEEQRKREENVKKRKAPPKPENKIESSWFNFESNNSKTTTSDDPWASAFTSQTATLGSSVEWGDAVSNEQSAKQMPAVKGPKKKYKVIFQFDARNPDELSLEIDDIVLVPDDQTGAEPGWLGGEKNGKSGWFPVAYVEKTDEAPSQNMGFSFSIPDSSIVPQSKTNDNQQSTAMTNSPEESPLTSIDARPPTVSPTPGQGETAPDGLQARALYPWKAKKENHLTFNKGDIITIKKQQEMWWSGDLCDKTGWFPKSYVKIVGGPSVNTSKSSSRSETPVGTLDEADITHSFHALEKREIGEYFVALYSYVSGEATDLTFNQGDVVLVSKAEGDWWTGSIGDKSGVFPANYVKKMDVQPGQKILKKPEIASVIASYTATGQEQLSLQPGQLIHVRKKSPSGWWEGELQARGQKRKIGWFPANYVKLLGSSARNTPECPSPATTTGSLGGTISVTNVPAQTVTPVTSQCSTPVPAVQSVKYVDHVVALYPYIAQREDEMTFQKDSVLNVISKDDASWWQGEINGRTGMFPSNYVGPLSSSSTQEHSWSSDPDVLAATSPEESKRQHHIQELIDTEETYMADMSIVLDTFRTPLVEGGALTEEESDSIFVNWKELILCNTKLLKGLRVRKKMCGKGQVVQIIGDLMCENLPHMTPYIRFCSCQLSASALIQLKTETVPEFKEIHKKCTQDTKTKGMPLSSFLLKPMQRITKYPLMIGKILQYTPEGHSDHQNLSDALAKAEEVCSQVNEGVREKENSDKLEWMQNHAQCDGLPERIVFNSVTNCLGPRKLLFSGTLYKVKSNKELVGFLFNDFLLLTTPMRALGSSSTNFVFDRKGSFQCRMYKTPVILNEVMVKKPMEDDADSCQFQILHIDRVYNLKAANINERDSWVRHLESASRSYLETERRKREKAHTLRHSGGVGRLLVVIMEGCDLKASDSNGKSDPYCEVSMGVQEHKTKVINNQLNPKWNASMQFSIKDMEQDVLCITVFDRDLFSPNDFLGRTEIRIKEILTESSEKRGPIVKRLLLHEVDRGEVIIKLDLQLYNK